MSDLTPTIRKSIEALIKQKADNAIRALTDEVQIDEDVILKRLLRAQGVPMTSDEISYEIRKLDRDRKDVDLDADPMIEGWAEEIENLDSQLEVEKDQLKLTANRRIEEIKIELRHALVGLETSFKEKETILREYIEARENALIELEHPGLTASIDNLRNLLPKAKEAERNLSIEVSRMSTSIETSRGRLIHLVRDAAVSAIGKLLSVSTTEDAHALVDEIPTVAEMISIAEDPEQGLEALVNRLRPSHQLSLAAPKDNTPNDDESDEMSPEILHAEIEEVE